MLEKSAELLSMRDITASNFGIVIAYLIPGVILLGGFAQLSPELSSWLKVTSQAELTIGGFLFATLASLTLGLIASTIRWAVIDTIHHRTGLSRPDLKYSRLRNRTHAFARIVEDRYRFYQFYSNASVALPIAEACFLAGGISWLSVIPAVVVEGVLLAGSRDTLKHYYLELAQVLGTSDPEMQSVE